MANRGAHNHEPDFPPRTIWESDCPTWFVIHTRSRHEAKVESALMQMGLEVFLPRIVTLSRRQDRKLYLNTPLFPGYLFVHTDLRLPNYHNIIKAPGVVGLLGITGLPIPVAVETVDSIRAIVESDRPYYNFPYLLRGLKVCIMAGPLAGAVGIIQRRLEKKRRLIVAVDLFQRSVAVELDDEAVEPWSLS
jgi:transcriptional antiterminator NusG